MTPHCLAAEVGFEPTQTGPKPAVLPLDDSALSRVFGAAAADLLTRSSSIAHFQSNRCACLIVPTRGQAHIPDQLAGRRSQRLLSAPPPRLRDLAF